MKTLADFKREMKVGTRWRGYHHRYLLNFPGREVIKVTSTQFGFLDPETGKISWCHFPKASDIEITGDDFVNIYVDYGKPRGRVKLLTYKKI